MRFETADGVAGLRQLPAAALPPSARTSSATSTDAPGAAELRRRINMVHTLAEANALVAAFRYQKAARA